LSSCTSATSTAPCRLRPAFDATGVSATNNLETGVCDVELSWPEAESQCPLGPGVSYNIYRSTDPYFEPVVGSLVVSGLASTSYTDASVAPLTTYYYMVKAEDGTSGGGGPANGGNESASKVRKKATAYANTNIPGTFSDGADGTSLLDPELPWTVTNTRASAGALSYHSAPDNWIYPALTCAALTTPEIELQAGAPMLSYAARFNLEFEWDGVVVEISTDGGATWVDLPPDQGYPSSFAQTGDPPANVCGYPATQGTFNCEDEGLLLPCQGEFATYTSDLSAYAGQTVRIRWNFSSDPMLEFDGFFLDEVTITEASTPGPCDALIFADGFESGDTSAWSVTEP